MSPSAAAIVAGMADRPARAAGDPDVAGRPVPFGCLIPAASCKQSRGGRLEGGCRVQERRKAARHYRNMAAERVSQAIKAKTAAGRQQWEIIAKQYLTLAEEYEKLL